MDSPVLASVWVLWGNTLLCETRKVVINNTKGCNEIKLTKRVVFRTVVFTTFSIIKKIPPINIYIFMAQIIIVNYKELTFIGY